MPFIYEIKPYIGHGDKKKVVIQGDKREVVYTLPGGALTTTTRSIEADPVKGLVSVRHSGDLVLEEKTVKSAKHYFWENGTLFIQTVKPA
jgi:hypothetical protein